MTSLRSGYYKSGLKQSVRTVSDEKRMIIRVQQTYSNRKDQQRKRATPSLPKIVLPEIKD